MQNYSYSLKQEDKVMRGMVQAANASEAVTKVRKLGGTVLTIEVVQEGGGFKLPHRKPSLTLKERIIFTEQVSVMLSAGITLSQALRSLQEEAPRKGVKEIYTALADDLEEGNQFSQVLAKHPTSFSVVYCNMVQSAEKSGNLAGVLSKLTEQQRKEYDLKGKVKGALMYPALISTLLVVVIGLVITFVIPRLSGLFADSGADLPASTKILLALSDFMVNSWYLLILGIIGFVVGIKFWGKTPTGRYALDSFKLRIPVIGGFLRKSIVARFAQTFAFLAIAGVPMLDIFKTLQGVAGNAVYARDIERIERDVANGVLLSVAIRKSNNFPPMVGQLVKVGEQSGDLGGMFEVIGNFFEKEVDTTARNLSTLLEPIIMVIMGTVIGFVLVSVLQPIYGLMDTI